MKDQDIHLIEYQALRQEIVVRLKLHHQIVNLAILSWLVLLAFGFWLWVNHVSAPEFNTFLLFIPLVFAGLIFNYQANQRTMEGVAKYLEDELRPQLEKITPGPVLKWEKYFAKRKATYQLASANHLFALLAPFLLPIYILIYRSPNHYQIDLAVADIILLIIILLNFRYKLYRVK